MSTDDPRDFCVGIDINTDKEVWLPYQDRVLGVTIIGKSGTGKSTVLENLVLADLAHGTPGLVIDPHGQLADRIIRRATPEQVEQIVLIEAIRTKPFGLNLLAVRDAIDEDDDSVTWAADSVVGAVKRLYGEDDEFLPRLERYLDLAVRTLIPSGLTLLDAPRLFTDKVFRNGCLSGVPDAKEREGLRAAWAAFDRLRPGEQITHTEALVNRLERLLAPPLIQGIVGSKQTTVPFDRALNGNSMLIVSLPSEKLSPERCNFIGALLLCALADRIFARRVVEKPPRLHLYLDEYQRFATSTTSDLLTQGRKYEVGLTLAHQDLHQIRDPYIRNSARHVGTLTVLAVTRPDAEALAGEFPVDPREEWVETIEEVDGTEPKYVFSPTPAEDIYLNGHTDPEIDRIAAIFFAYTPRWTKELIMSALEIEHRNQDILTFFGDPRKSAGVVPRSGNEDVNLLVQVPAYDVNDLLVDAMAGKLQNKEALLEKLLVAETWSPQIQLKLPENPNADTVVRSLRDEGVSTLYYHLGNASKSKIEAPVCHCPPLDLHAERIAQGHRLYKPSRPQTSNDPIGLHLSGCPAKAKPYLTKEEEEINAAVRIVYESEAHWYVQNAIRSWLSVQLQDIPALIRNEYTSAIRAADEEWVNLSLRNCWDYQWRWYGRIEYVEDKSGVRPVLNDFAGRQAEFDEHRDAYLSMLACARLRLRCLVWLCEGLYKSPVLVPSGEQQPRMRTRHIVHPAQTQQDALNEFASTLVHPSEQYVAHVRAPEGYHPTKLNRPIEVEHNPQQLKAVQERSRRLYRIDHDPPEDGSTPAPRADPPPSGPMPATRRIGRRPRATTEPAQVTLPESARENE